MQIKTVDLSFIIRSQFTHVKPQVTSGMIAITQRLHMLILGMIIMHRAIHLTAVLGVTVIFRINVGSFSQKILICQYLCFHKSCRCSTTENRLGRLKNTAVGVAIDDDLFG